MSSQITAENQRKVVGQVVIESIEILEKSLPPKAKGVSLKSIKKNVEDNYNVDDIEAFGNIMKLYIKKALKKGLVTQASGNGLNGSFVLNKKKVKEVYDAKGSDDEESELEDEPPKKRQKKNNVDENDEEPKKTTKKSTNLKSKKADAKPKEKKAKATKAQQKEEEEEVILSDEN